MSVQPLPPPPAIDLLSEQPQDCAKIEALLDRAFGPGRFAKSSERVREMADFAPELSVCAWEGERLLGLVRLWRVRVGETPVMFLGPLAVDQDQRCAGLGGMLVERACEAAAEAGERCVLLVGDAPYFQRFGFVQAQGVTLPAPADPRRVLVRSLGEHPPLSGAVQPR